MSPAPSPTNVFAASISPSGNNVRIGGTGVPVSYAFWISAAALATALGFDLHQTTKGAYALSRNFYGVLKVTEHQAGDPSEHRLILQHGGTIEDFLAASPTVSRRQVDLFLDLAKVQLAECTSS